MLNHLMLRFKFCTKNIQKIPKQLNSINPVNVPVAFGYYFLKEWSEENIYELIDPSKSNIKKMQLVKNKLGEATGKVMFHFKDEQTMKKYIDRYNEDFITTKNSTHKVILKPYELKTEQKSKENEISQEKTKNIVKVTNLDFDITTQELLRLCQDYGKVVWIDMSFQPDGKNKGAAKIYFTKKKEAENFSYFVDGLLYKERKLKGQVINANSQNSIRNKKEANENNEKLPQFLMKMNEELHRLYLKETTKANPDN